MNVYLYYIFCYLFQWVKKSAKYILDVVTYVTAKSIIL